MLSLILWPILNLSAQDLSAPYILQQKVLARPGLSYLHIRDTLAAYNAYVLELSLAQLKANVEVFQVQDRLGQFQALSSLGIDSRYKDGEVLGAINGNFWIVKGQNQPDALIGQIHSGSMQNGHLISPPNAWNRGRTKDPEELKAEIGFFYLDHKRGLILMI